MLSAATYDEEVKVAVLACFLSSERPCRVHAGLFTSSFFRLHQFLAEKIKARLGFISSIVEDFPHSDPPMQKPLQIFQPALSHHPGHCGCGVSLHGMRVAAASDLLPRSVGVP